MKKGLFFIIILLGFTGCEKISFDYRTKYVGDYHFLVHEQYMAVPKPVDTMYTVDGQIALSGFNINSLVLSYPKKDCNFIIDFAVHEDGTIDKSDISYDMIRRSGEFESSDKIKFSFGITSPGGFWYEEITGEKK